MTLEAGRAYVELVPRLAEGWGAKVAGQVEAATQPVLSRVSQTFDRVGDRLRASGAKMTMYATLPLLAVGVGAFKLASDLEESRNKVQVVFGEMSNAIESWANTAARSLGISRQEALEAAGTYGNLFRAMGIGLPVATDMSTKLVGLASDLASFNNADPKEVLESLRSGLVGEIEPLRKFGVNLTQARIEAKALELGLWDGVSPIDASAKAQAAYALILEDTKTAQGDFANTSDGAANKQRILLATLKDTGAELGMRLLPIGQKILDFVGELVAGFDKLSPTMQDIILVVAGLAIVAGPLAFILGGIASLIALILTPVGLIVVAIIAVIVALTALGVDWEEVWADVQRIAADAWAWLEANVGPVIDAILAGFADAIGWLEENWPAIWDVITTAVADALAWLDTNVVPIIEKTVEAIGVAIGVLVAIVLAVVDAVLWVWDNFGEQILNAARAAWDFLVGIIEAALSIIGGIIDIFIGIFTLDWDTFWNGVSGIITGVWDAIVATVGFALDILGNIIEVALTVIGLILTTAWSIITGAVTGAWSIITGIVTGAIDGIVTAITSIPGILLGIVGAVLNAALAVGGAIVNGIVSALNGAVSLVGDIAGAIIGFIKRAWNAGIDFINDAIPNDIDIPFAPDVDLPDNPFSFAKLHSGGTVPGFTGQEVAILAQAGETVRTAGQEAALQGKIGGTGGVTLAVELNGGTVLWARDLAEELVDPIHEALLRKKRHDGDLGLVDERVLQSTSNSLTVGPGTRSSNA